MVSLDLIKINSIIDIIKIISYYNSYKPKTPQKLSKKVLNIS